LFFILNQLIQEVYSFTPAFLASIEKPFSKTHAPVFVIGMLEKF